MPGIIAQKIEHFMKEGSWIRKMFEEGAALRAQLGADNVYDYSLGNPMGEPPARFINALKKSLSDPTPGTHSYMPNAGYLSVRNTLAHHLKAEFDLPIEGKNLVMTVGAAGALNVALKTLVNPGETVIIFAPYFVEYGFYIDNIGAVRRIVETDVDFNLNLDAIDMALDASVKALILNTPNNPTGRVYPEKTLKQLGELLESRSREFGHPIYILSDEPYKRIVYDGVTVPCMLKMHRDTLICTSYSKELAIPGERLGYVLVNPEIPDAQLISDGLTFCNRILGFVNAPALMQRGLEAAIDAIVDISQYVENRALLLESLRSYGYDIVTPEGAFYLFPRSPIDDEVEFIQELKKERILAVPGRGFGRKGYFRLSYCVTRKMIEDSLPGFKRAIERVTRH